MRRSAAALGLLLWGCAAPTAEQWLARAESAARESVSDVRVARLNGADERTIAATLTLSADPTIRVGDVVLLGARNGVGRLSAGRMERRAGPGRLRDHLVAAWVRAGLEPAWTTDYVWSFPDEGDLPDPFRVSEASLGARTSGLQEIRYVLHLPWGPRYAHRLWLDVETGLPVRRDATTADGQAGLAETYAVEWGACPGARRSLEASWIEIDPRTGRPR